MKAGRARSAYWRHYRSARKKGLTRAKAKAYARRKIRLARRVKKVTGVLYAKKRRSRIHGPHATMAELRSLRAHVDKFFAKHGL